MRSVIGRGGAGRRKGVAAEAKHLGPRGAERLRRAGAQGIVGHSSVPPSLPMTEPTARRAWRAAAAAAVAALVLALVTLAVFERAYPLVDVGLRLSREEAIARA